MAIIPQVITEDRASGAQVIDGSLKLDRTFPTYLSRTPSSEGNRKIWTWSCWVKLTTFNTDQQILSCAGPNHAGGADISFISFTGSNKFQVYHYPNGGTNYYRADTARVIRGIGWYHLVAVLDTTQATDSNRIKIYVNGELQTIDSGSVAWPQPNYSTAYINSNRTHLIGQEPDRVRYPLSANITNYYLIDGQALDPSYFGFTDPLTNTWRPKKYEGTFGTNGFYLPMDGNSPIGEDKSGRGNNWTPVNFGGSNTIEKATGALPILNTVSGGNVATVGVRTDAYASNLVLALPLGGDANDVSNQINSGSTTKTFTANGNAAPTRTSSNFYGGSYDFDGGGDYLEHTLSDSTLLLQGSVWTVECWVRPNSSSDRVIFNVGNGTASNSNYVWQLRYISSKFQGALYNGTTQRLTHATNTSSLNDWHHVVYQRNGNTQTLYVNGILESTTSWTETPNNNSSCILTVGGGYNGSDAIDAQIQDARIYTGVEKYTENFIPAAATNPDIVSDTPSGVAYGSELKQIIEGSVNGGVSNGDTLLVGNSSDFNFGSGDFTVELFAYHTSTAGNDTLVGMWNSGANRRAWMIDIEADQGRLRGYWSTDGSAFSNVQTATKYISRHKWNHIVFCRQGNTMRLYLNGNQEATATESSSLYNNVTDSLGILSATDVGNDPCKGHISNVRILKGTCLYPDGTSFTPPSAPLTNVTNTVLLACQSPTSATAYEVSPGTITISGSVSASAFNPFTTDINAVRGQESGYATWNPLESNLTLFDGNLSVTSPTGDTGTRSNIAVSSGKWFWEYTVGSVVVNSYVGVSQYLDASGLSGDNYVLHGTGSNNYSNNTGGSWSITNAAFTTGMIIGCAFDYDGGNVYLYKDGILAATFSGANFAQHGAWKAHISFNASVTTPWEANFGQKPFRFTPPDGFRPLCSANLPRPTKTAVNPDKYFNTVLWTGDGNSDRTVTGVGFKPDFVWIANRDRNTYKPVYDTVRGATYMLRSNTTSESASFATVLSSFDSDGFTVGTDTAHNANGEDIVAWCWKAGGDSNTFNIDGIGYASASAAGLDGGTITPTGASVNTESGFSILQYDGTGATATLDHGLNDDPKFILIKRTNVSGNSWAVYHDALGANKQLLLNSTNAASNDTNGFNAVPSSGLIRFGDGSQMDTNQSGAHICYAWSDVPGLQKFGSFAGNNNNNGSYIHLGFKPALVIVKAVDNVETVASTAATGWGVWDSARMPNNPGGNPLFINQTGNETKRGNNSSDNTGGSDGNGLGGFLYVDLLSNGFKCRTSAAEINSSQKHIYMAWAEAPTFNLYGGQANAR